MLRPVRALSRVGSHAIRDIHNYADQSVEELRREQQAATVEILKVISSSPTTYTVLWRRSPTMRHTFLVQTTHKFTASKMARPSQSRPFCAFDFAPICYPPEST